MRNCLTILLLISSVSVSAQRDLYSGLFPEMAVSHSTGDWKYTLKIESQNYFYHHQATEQWDPVFRKQNDLQAFADFKINPLLSISAGYQYRLSSTSDNTLRLIQQLSISQPASRVRIGHRIRLDQTFLQNALQFRIRYRYSLEIPLKGHSLDVKEPYLLLQDEPILSFESGESAIENRLHAALGYKFKSGAKIQSGMDYRTDRYLSDGFRQRIWWKTGLFLKI